MLRSSRAAGQRVAGWKPALRERQRASVTATQLVRAGWKPALQAAQAAFVARALAARVLAWRILIVL
jgi:hypothetical protein